MDDETTHETTVETTANVGAGPAADAGPTDEPAAVAPPGRSRLAVAMLVVSGLLLIGAVVFGVLGLSAQSETSDARDAATAATERRHDLADQQEQLETDRGELRARVLGLPSKYFAVEDEFTALAEAQTRYFGVLDQAIDLHNSGDVAGATALVSGDGANALAPESAIRSASVHRKRLQYFDGQGDALNYGWCGAHSQFVKLYHPAREFWSQCQFKALTRERGTT